MAYTVGEMLFSRGAKGRQFARESVTEAPTGPVSKDLRRRMGRALEWYIVGLIAKKVPPADRLYLLYEVSKARAKHHPRIERARAEHGRGMLWLGDFALVTVTRAELAAVVGTPAWMEAHIDGGVPLAENEGRCIVVRDVEEDPEVLIFDARGVRRRT